MLFTDHEALMNLALEEAKEGITNNEGGPFGAIIVKEGSNGEAIIVARAHNQVLKDNDSTSHGEMNAIRKACKALNTFNLKGCELYTTGIPCPMCFGAICWSNIDKVYYGCNLEDTEKIGFGDKLFFEKIKQTKKYEDNFIEISRDRCLDLYQDYLDIHGKADY